MAKYIVKCPECESDDFIQQEDFVFCIKCGSLIPIKADRIKKVEG